jgi:hypothetical protein
MQSVGDWHSALTGEYLSTSGDYEGIEFKANGTFESFTLTIGPIASFVTVHKGNYRVEGNIIYLTNVMEKMTYLDNKVRPPSDQSYDYRPIGDHRLSWEDNSPRIIFKTLDLVNGCVYFLHGGRSGMNRLVE